MTKEDKLRELREQFDYTVKEVYRLELLLRALNSHKEEIRKEIDEEYLREE